MTTGVDGQTTSGHPRRAKSGNPGVISSCHHGRSYLEDPPSACRVEIRLPSRVTNDKFDMGEKWYIQKYCPILFLSVLPSTNNIKFLNQYFQPTDYLYLSLDLSKIIICSNLAVSMRTSNPLLIIQVGGHWTVISFIHVKI